MKRLFWSADELAILHQHYATIGARGCAEMLPGRNRRAIRLKAFKLGLQRVEPMAPRRPNAWTASEDARMREFYPVGGTNTARHNLPRRSRDAIRQRARILGLKIGSEKRRELLILAKRPPVIQIPQPKRPLTFEEKLALVASGKATIAPALVKHHLTPTIRRAA